MSRWGDTEGRGYRRGWEVKVVEVKCICTHSPKTKSPMPGHSVLSLDDQGLKWKPYVAATDYYLFSNVELEKVDY